MSDEKHYIPAGMHAVTPALAVRDGEGAIQFYKRAFGAEELYRLVGPGGRLDHVELRIGDSVFTLAEEEAAMGNFSPDAMGGAPVRVLLYVSDVDAVFKRAVAEGARAIIPVNDQFYGDRSGRLEDPYGHIWIVATHIEDVPPEEMQRRYDEMIKEQGA